jgi:23S rRNA (adenine-N6)-dimethyltransferase
VAGSRRRWGWHQLDPDVATRLVIEAGLPRRALVLDVGAGLGAVTTPLVDAGHRVIAVENHPLRARALEDLFGDQVRVVHADAADLRLPRRPFHVVANVPFGVTSALLRRLLHRGSRLESAHLVVQEQAAVRWAGPDAPGRGRWGREYVVALGRRLPPRAFVPPPRVSARVLVIVRRAGGGGR